MFCLHVSVMLVTGTSDALDDVVVGGIVLDLGNVSGSIECHLDGDGVVNKICSGWPILIYYLEGDESRESKSIQIDWDAESGGSVRLSEKSNEHPSWSDEHGESNIWSCLKSEEL